ncbi:MAG: GumC family protein, partial [Sphingomonadaceae bacterium]
MSSSVLTISPEYLPTTSPAAAGTGAAPMLVQNWQVLKRFKWTAIGILGVSLVLGILVTFLMTPQYTATSRIEISRQQESFANVRGVNQTDARQDLEFYQTQYSLLEARSLAERVARELRLASRDDFFINNGVDPEEIVALPGDRSAMRAKEKEAVDILLDNIHISPIPRSALVDVSYSSASPEMAEMIANSWVQQFIQSSIDRRFNSTSDARSFLEQRLADLRVRVEDSERKAVAYAERNNIVVVDRPPTASGGGSRTLAAANLEALNDELQKATAARVEAQGRVVASGTPTEALANPAVNALRGRRGELVAQRAELLATFTQDYPQVKALQQQISALDGQIRREEDRVRSARSNELQEATAREKALLAKVNSLKGQLAEQQRDSIRYNIFQREADTNRQLYDALLQRYKEIGVAGIDANNISVVDTAEVPEKPSSPK